LRLLGVGLDLESEEDKNVAQLSDLKCIGNGNILVIGRPTAIEEE
jgi:hypothetical protein